MASDVVAVLNATRERSCPRRHEATEVPRAIASVAGAGPKRSAVVMKKVSAMVTLAYTDPIFMENEPVTIASAAKKSHSHRCGVVCIDTSDWTMTRTPSVATRRVQTSRRLFIAYTEGDEILWGDSQQ